MTKALQQLEVGYPRTVMTTGSRFVPTLVPTIPRHACIALSAGQRTSLHTATPHSAAVDVMTGLTRRVT